MNIALILSGGTGKRLGTSVPKQYLEVGGQMIICYALEIVLFHRSIDAVQIVADHSWKENIEKLILRLQNKYKDKPASPVYFSMPGENRQLSIYNGLCGIKHYADDNSFVMVHDAARPMLTREMVSDYFEKVKGHAGLLPVLPMKDTVYLSTNGACVTSLIDRSQVFAGQAPEIFDLDKYLAANERLLPDAIKKIKGSTEPAVLAGMDIVMVPGDENNFKITTQADLERFQRIVRMGR